MIFSQIQWNGEIYKIHGCCTQPNTIVIDENDYLEFEDRNAYLAAKILTIFLEHPIIFIGYSVNDKNIKSILKSIVKCLSKEKLELLKQRLIFIEWNNSDKEDEISTHSISFEDEKTLEMTKVFIRDFSILYELLLDNKFKYNTTVLRRLKEEIYELVVTNEPTTKMKVIGIEDNDKLDEVEVVVGVGILSEFGKKGYAGLKAEEIYTDVLFDNGNLDTELVVKESLPILLKHHSNSIPIYKYISQVEFELPEQVQKEIKTNFDDLLSRTIRSRKSKGNLEFDNLNEILKQCNDYKCLDIISLLDKDKIDISILGDFLRKFYYDNPSIFIDGKPSDKTNFRRLIKIYDWLKYYDKKES